ncbi:hypothetical protein Ahia01_001147500 [Argonauta hians]
MLSTQAQKALIGWEPVSPRLITAKFRTSHQRITLKIIVAYAPTNDSAEESKEDFYRELQNILGKEMVILIGDMNAKVGKEKSGYALIMGQYGVGCRNENEQIFLDFCADHRNRTTKYDVKKLDEQPYQQHFQLTLRNKFQALDENSNEEEGVNERWEKIKNVRRTTCEESLGKRRKENKGWITQRTLDCMKESKRANDHLNNAKTRAAKQKYIKEYNQIHKDIKKNVRVDKRGYYDDHEEDDIGSQKRHTMDTDEST